MTITLALQPEIEKGLLAQAKAQGVSLADYVQEIIVRQAQVFLEAPTVPRTGQELIDACAKVRGLLTDEEVDSLSRRTRSWARPVDLE